MNKLLADWSQTGEPKKDLEPTQIPQEELHAMFEGRTENFVTYIGGEVHWHKSQKIRADCKILAKNTAIIIGKKEETRPHWMRDHVKITMIRRTEDRNQHWEILEDRVPLDQTLDVSENRPSRMIIFIQPPRETNKGQAFSANFTLFDEGSEFTLDFSRGRTMPKSSRKVVEEGLAECKLQNKWLSHSLSEDLLPEAELQPIVVVAKPATVEVLKKTEDVKVTTPEQVVEQVKATKPALVVSYPDLDATEEPDLVRNYVSDLEAKRTTVTP